MRAIIRDVCAFVALCALPCDVLASGGLAPSRDPRSGALDASLIVLVRQQEPEVFRIEEVFLGDTKVGATIRLPKLQLYTFQEFGQKKVETITAQTRILLFLQPNKQATGGWDVSGYGYSYFWRHEPAKVEELRKIARDMVALRKSWEKARDIPDPRARVEALWPFLWEGGPRVIVRTKEELKKTAPVAGDVIAERFDRLAERDRQMLVVDAGQYGGEKLHGLLKRYLQDLQRRYEQFLRERGPGSESLIEDWGQAPQEIKDIWGCLYYGLAGLAKFKDRGDLPFIRDVAAWAIKYRFKQTCNAALVAFYHLPDKENLAVIDAIWKEFSRRPWRGNELSPADVTTSLCAHRYPETVPILAPFLEHESVRGRVRRALQEIVGQDLGDRPQPWLDWYNRQGKKP